MAKAVLFCAARANAAQLVGTASPSVEIGACVGVKVAVTCESSLASLGAKPDRVWARSPPNRTCTLFFHTLSLTFPSSLVAVQPTSVTPVLTGIPFKKVWAPSQTQLPK